MEKQNRKVDDFFKEALKDHSVIPSEAAKAAFLKEAATLTNVGKPRRKIYLYLSGIILLVLVCAGIYISQQGSSLENAQGKTLHSSSIIKSKSTFTERKTNVNETPLPLIASLSNSKQHVNYIPVKNHLQDPLSSSPNHIKQLRTEESSSQNESSSSSLLLSSRALTTATQKELSPGSGSSVEENPLKNQSGKQEIPDQKPVRADSISLPPLNPEVLSINDRAEKEEKQKPSKNSKNLNFDAGVYYSPEWMNNTLEGEKYVNNFGIEGTFHFGNYSIRTGAGLSITKGTNELLIKTNDYLGNFNQLDSVNFVWDATHTHLIPTYYFTRKSVWDTLVKTQYSNIIKRYTYLQVPFILGYDFWKNDHFSIGVRIGPILSVLIKTEQVSDNYDPGKDRIIQINMITPERIQTYWQFMAGINAAFSLSRKIGIEVEPEIRYYFNSVYEKPSNNKKPWSVGFRAVFLIKK